MNCATCENKECYDGKDCTKLKVEIENAYSNEDVKSLRISASLEAQHYMKKPRLEELILYAKEMGYKRLGIAFCIGLEHEAKLIHEILNKDFEVHSVCCKVCGIDKDDLELARLHPEKKAEAMCNPLGQATVLNREKTELNVLLGLCIGHDILFTKYSEAPVTTFAVKDRLLAHNPLGAVYSNYYRDKFLHIKEGD